MRATLSAIVLACFISQASAVTIELEFTGLASGSGVLNGTWGLFHNKPFTADFIYNTDLGTLGDHRLDGGLVSAKIDLDSYGTWSGAYYRGGPSYLIWNEDFSLVTADAGGGYYNLLVTNASTFTKFGAFQFGQCPTQQGGPCGYMTTTELVSVAIVPFAVVGGGLPGLLSIIVLLIYRARRAVS